LIRIHSRNRDDMVKACQIISENSITSVDQHFDNLFERYQKMVDEKITNSSYESTVMINETM
jgi:hypothetical protein